MQKPEKNIIKDKRCCFVCLKGGHISKNCASKIQCYKCSKRHIAFCDFEQNKNNKVYSQPSCNFTSPANKVLLQTAIVTVENDSFQYEARMLFDNG